MKGSNVKIREMMYKDIKDVLEIEKMSFATPWSENSFVMELEKNKLSRYIVAEKDNRIVGYGGIWVILEEGHITNIAVHKEFRQMGIGELLVKGLIHISKELSIERMTLEVRQSNNPAISLYEKYGFKSVGIRENYYSDNNEDAIIMWKELNL